MKKIKIIELTIAAFIPLIAIICNPLQAQTIQKSNPIPDNVVMIAKKSCINCHAEPGKKIALMHVNLSKWDTYTAEKQADRAKDMCNMISKGKMPPKEFKKDNPGFVITADEIKTICDWSASLQAPKK